MKTPLVDTGKETTLAITRESFRVIFDDNVGTTPTINTSAPVPNGEAWTIQRVIFGDRNVGDNKSGGFKFEFGNGGSLEVITLAWLTGQTKEIIINKQFEGDGVKQFRATRVNGSPAPKNMFVIIEGFKRL